MVDFMSTNYLSQIIDTPGIRFVQFIKRRICIQFIKISTPRVRLCQTPLPSLIVHTLKIHTYNSSEQTELVYKRLSYSTCPVFLQRKSERYE